mgnify:FL=1
MRIIDLINICSFKKIAQKIVLHYGSCDLIKYKELYEKLKEMELPVSKDFYIYISAYQEKNDDYILVHDFNEDDTNLFLMLVVIRVRIQLFILLQQHLLLNFCNSKLMKIHYLNIQMKQY